jgi:hypothetical protein
VRHAALRGLARLYRQPSRNEPPQFADAVLRAAAGTRKPRVYFVVLFISLSLSQIVGEDAALVDALLGDVLLDDAGDVDERVTQLVALYGALDASARLCLARVLQAKAQLRTALGLYLEAGGAKGVRCCCACRRFVCCCCCC